jgi:hypothetical protein
MKEQLLNKVSFLQKEYGIKKEVFELAEKFITILSSEDITPIRISDLEIDDSGTGYFFSFQKENFSQIYLEIYSDLEFGFIAINKDHKIVINEDITDFKVFIEFMKK